jgi:hypothetical protein
VPRSSPSPTRGGVGAVWIERKDLRVITAEEYAREKRACGGAPAVPGAWWHEVWRPGGKKVLTLWVATYRDKGMTQFVGWECVNEVAG